MFIELDANPRPTQKPQKVSKKLQLSSKKKMKEMHFSSRTESGDYQVKMRKLRGFLEDGHELKISVQHKQAKRRNTQFRGVAEGNIHTLKATIIAALADLSHEHGSTQDIGWRLVFRLSPKARPTKPPGDVKPIVGSRNP